MVCVSDTWKLLAWVSIFVIWTSQRRHTQLRLLAADALPTDVMDITTDTAQNTMQSAILYTCLFFIVFLTRIRLRNCVCILQHSHLQAMTIFILLDLQNTILLSSLLHCGRTTYANRMG